MYLMLPSQQLTAYCYSTPVPSFILLNKKLKVRTCEKLQLNNINKVTALSFREITCLKLYFNYKTTAVVLRRNP